MTIALVKLLNYSREGSSDPIVWCCVRYSKRLRRGKLLLIWQRKKERGKNSYGWNIPPPPSASLKSPLDEYVVVPVYIKNAFRVHEAIHLEMEMFYSPKWISRKVFLPKRKRVSQDVRLIRWVCGWDMRVDGMMRWHGIYKTLIYINFSTSEFLGFMLGAFVSSIILSTAWRKREKSSLIDSSHEKNC